MTQEKNAVLELLQSGRSAVEQGWCQGAFGKKSEGQIVTDMGAASLVCATGGVMKAGHLLQILDGLSRGHREKLISNAVFVLDQAARARGEGLIDASAFNDLPGRTQDEVLDLYDEAYELAEASRPALFWHSQAGNWPGEEK